MCDSGSGTKKLSSESSCCTENSSVPELLRVLPSDPGQSWAVYLLVLEELSCCPKIYIGSGTKAVSGVRERFGQYRRLEMLPRYVEKAIDDPL
jgi:hypothetical protein